jgi:hypothetical protein
MTHEISTELGAVRLTLHSGTRGVAVFEHLKVFRVEHSGQLHLECANGAWRLQQEKNGSDYNALHINSRWDGSKHNEASYAAKNKIGAVLVDAVNEWLAERPEAVRDAERKHLEKNAQNASSKVDAIRLQLDEALAELRQAQKLYHEF